MTKVAATSLSSNTIGQIFIGMMVTPPKPGDPSHALFKEESEAIFAGLKRRAVMLTKGLNAIAGLESQTIEGAMYAFAKIAMPTKAQEAAAAAGIPADDFWCLSLVEQTGIICVPGSGFGQRKGTFHFRITILPPDDMLKGMLARLAKFQQDFLTKYANGHWAMSIVGPHFCYDSSANYANLYTVGPHGTPVPISRACPSSEH